MKSFFLVLVVLLTACSKNGTTYFLKSRSAPGIHVQMPIMYNGDSIGSVTGIESTSEQLIAMIELKHSIKICNSSTFKMVELDFFNSIIELNSNCNKKTFWEGDTILVDLDNLSKQKDPGIKLTPEMIESARKERERSDTTYLDSIKVYIEKKK